MVNVFLFGHLADGDVPASEEAMRPHAVALDPDAPPAEAEGSGGAGPDRNQIETFSDPDTGLGTRQLASPWESGEQYAPSWAAEAGSITDSMASVNRRIASSGTAAQREAEGQFGHGSMPYALGIEPVLQGGETAYGGEYFAGVDRGGVQPTMTGETGVQPNIQQQSVASAVSIQAGDNSREAFQSDLYASVLDALTGTGAANQYGPTQ